jgi:hypothetical protein
MCRKVHGAAFATYVVTSTEGFRWIQGDERVRRYESSPGGHRSFCSRCGSIVTGDPAEGRIFMPAGCLDDDPGTRPLAHLFVASKSGRSGRRVAKARFEGAVFAVEWLTRSRAISR